MTHHLPKSIPKRDDLVGLSIMIENPELVSRPCFVLKRAVARPTIPHPRSADGEFIRRSARSKPEDRTRRPRSPFHPFLCLFLYHHHHLHHDRGHRLFLLYLYRSPSLPCSLASARRRSVGYRAASCLAICSIEWSNHGC